MENAFTVWPRGVAYGAPSYRFAPTSVVSMSGGKFEHVTPATSFDSTSELRLTREG